MLLVLCFFKAKASNKNTVKHNKFVLKETM